MQDDDGRSLFDPAQLSSADLTLEHRIDHLGEPTATGLDVYLSGDHPVAIECKFTEAGVGRCSRPNLVPGRSSYGRQYCDGNYARMGRRRSGDRLDAGAAPAGERCPLTEIGVRYWHYVPSLFRWENDVDHVPCPLHRTYQLVRNLLAIGVRPDGTVSAQAGHVILLYDQRNPAFQPGGEGLAAYHETRAALHNPAMLRRCSWGRLIHHLRNTRVLPWLTDHLALKVGF